MEETAALAVSFLDPDVVMLKIVFFGFDVAANGIDDAAVGSEGESGHFVVDVLKRLVEVLRASLRNETAAEMRKEAARKDAQASGVGPVIEERSWFGMVRSVGMAAGFLSWRKFHYFDARSVGIVSIEAVFSVAADLGAVERL